jgi:hypothetical protein
MQLIVSSPLMWLEDRRCDLLPVQYFHVVFTVPACLAAIAAHGRK